MSTKSTTTTKHFLRRLNERYNIRFKASDIPNIVKKIQSHDFTLVRKQSNRVSIHDVEIDGRKIRLVYDKIRKLPVTALQPDWIGRDVQACGTCHGDGFVSGFMCSACGGKGC